MKRFYLLCLLLPLYSLSQAQSFSLLVEGLNSVPEFSVPYLIQNEVKALQVKTQKVLRPGVVVMESTLIREFTDEGLMSREIEVRSGADTSRIASFHYNPNGYLGWKQTTDIRWGKTYRTGYRFNNGKQVFQVRDYEMLANEQVMLLETRQYIYNVDSQLIAIRWKQGSKTIKVQHYAYYDNDFLAEEKFENGAGIIEKVVNYEYYDNGAVKKVKHTDAEGKVKSYGYVYDNNGLPSKIEWTEGPDLSGTIAYEFNNDGLLLAIERSATNSPLIRQEFTYEKFQQSSAVNLAER